MAPAVPTTSYSVGVIKPRRAIIYTAPAVLIYLYSVGVMQPHHTPGSLSSIAVSTRNEDQSKENTRISVVAGSAPISGVARHAAGKAHRPCISSAWLLGSSYRSVVCS